MNIAAIDIGSASFQLLILSEDGRIVCDELRYVGLGSKMGRSGLLPPDKVQETINGKKSMHIQTAICYKVPIT